MERVIERCCGLDVHKKTLVACVRGPGQTSAREQHVRTFGTATAELLVGSSCIRVRRLLAGRLIRMVAEAAAFGSNLVPTHPNPGHTATPPPPHQPSESRALTS